MIKKEPIFRAFRVTEENNKFTSSIEEMSFSPLGKDEILVRIHYSSLNYKDALSATGNKGVTRKYPHTPGIDAAGVIEKSGSISLRAGEKVIITGYDLGMNSDGGFAEYVKVPSAWAVRLPENMSMREAMIFGTAGLTAGISVLRLTELVKPEDGSIVVSGATGGVGSLSVSILNKLGYSVVAITGKDSEKEYLTKLGAKEILSRNEIETSDKRALLMARYGGGIDTVGGGILETLLKSTKPMGVVTCCGNAASARLELTVFPFILRGVTLIGIASQNYPMEYRLKIWELLANEWKPDQLEDSITEITMEELPQKIALMLKGKLKGRTILRMA